MTTPARDEPITPRTTAGAWPERFCDYRSGIPGADWTAALTELISAYLRPERRAGRNGAYAGPVHRYEDDLADFTSVAKPDLFTGRHARFEEEALRLLAEYAHGGVLREEAMLTVLLAPSAQGER